MVNFYTHIDSGVPTFQTIQDKRDYYSAYIRYFTQWTCINVTFWHFRVNGENLMFEGHVKSSLVGENQTVDDVTTGRNLVLHLFKGDEVCKPVTIRFLG